MGAAYWLRRGGNLLLSSLFEGGEEIGQSLISNHALGEENDWGRLLYEDAVGVGVGLVFGGGGTALDTAMGRYREYRAEAGEARRFKKRECCADCGDGFTRICDRWPECRRT